MLGDTYSPWITKASARDSTDVAAVLGLVDGAVVSIVGAIVDRVSVESEVEDEDGRLINEVVLGIRERRLLMRSM